MTSRAQVLAERRVALLARSAALRAELASQSAVISGSLEFVDRGVAFARSGKLRPIITIAAAVLMLLRPRGAWRIASRGVVLLPLVQRLLPLARHLLPIARRLLPQARRLLERVKPRATPAASDPSG